MAESVNTQTKPKPTTRDGSTDARALAQVEKWMAMIRELNREKAKT